MIKDFRDLIVWQKAIQFFLEVCEDINKLPKAEVAKIIASQVVRSAGSISANIAEGYGRHKGKEYEHYLYVARGSANETVDWYEKLKRLGYISLQIYERRVKSCAELIAILSRMISTLEKK